MIDGSDVDAQINKKRAHKIILAEALEHENKTRFKLGAKRRGNPPKRRADSNQEGDGKDA